MSGDLDALTHPTRCLSGAMGEGRQLHYRATVRRLSIEREWCADHRTYHYFQIERQVERPRTFGRIVADKARTVALAVVVGLSLALTTVAIGASALAAMR